MVKFVGGNGQCRRLARIPALWLLWSTRLWNQTAGTLFGKPHSVVIQFGHGQQRRLGSGESTRVVIAVRTLFDVAMLLACLRGFCAPGFRCYFLFNWP
jgi:hypothetical protein